MRSPRTDGRGGAVRRVGRYRLHGRIVASEIALPELPAAARGTPACRIERDREAATRVGSWFHRWRVGGRTHLTFGRRDDGYVLRFPGMAEFTVSADGRLVRCRAKRGLAPTTLRHLLIDQVLPLALSRFAGLVLHASAVHVPGVGAIAFAGATGCGKSTLAGALSVAGCGVLSDDCLVLDGADDGVARAPAGYPGLRLWRDAASALGMSGHGASRVAHYSTKQRVRPGALPFRARASRLCAIFVLSGRYSGGAACRVASLPPRERFMALTRYLYLMDVTDRAQLARAFRDLAALVDHVPVYRLQVVDDRRRLKELARAIRTHAVGRLERPA